MDDNLPIEDDISEFNSRLSAWNAPLAADMNLYCFMELALNTLEALEWVKSSVMAGAPLVVSSNPDEAIFEFANHFFERWKRVHLSILLTGRNSKDEVHAALTPFLTKLCAASSKPEIIRQMYETKRKLGLEKAYADLAEARAKRKKYDERKAEVTYYCGLAKDFEAKGDLVEAACNLEKAIISGKASGLNPHDFLHAHERLFILYRKLKKYSAEERTIIDAIRLESQFDAPICKRRIEKYEERLGKCRILIQKENE